MNYGVVSTVESVKSDLKAALIKKEYYGLVMISASLGGGVIGGEIKYAAIELLTSSLGDDNYQNSVIAFCIKRMLTKNYLIPRCEFRKDRLASIYDFVREFREKGAESKGYGYLEGLDNMLLEQCVSEMLR